MKKKIVLAFSGGLDTTYCLVYLQKVLNFEVHTVFVNSGYFSIETIETIENKAICLGATSHKTIDISEQYFNEGIKYLIFGNVLKNDTYPLSVSSERIFQAMVIAQYAIEIGVKSISHGSTGAGNDQVRFDLVFQILIPEVEIFTPIRDLQISREEEIQQLQNWGVIVNQKRVKYSINEGLWGTSIGGKETLTSNLSLPEEAWPFPITAEEEYKLIITFNKGIPEKINGINLDPVSLIKELDKIARPYGIGRDVHVGDTIIGIKGRVAFDAAAPMILIKAHQLLEKHTLTKWQIHLKKQLSEWYGMFFHDGHFMDPVMRNIEKFLDNSQERVCGEVIITLKPSIILLEGINSEFDLMKNDIAVYGEGANAWTGEDVKGFIKLNGIQTSIWQSLKQT